MQEVHVSLWNAVMPPEGGWFLFGSKEEDEKFIAWMKSPEGKAAVKKGRLELEKTRKRQEKLEQKRRSAMWDATPWQLREY